MKNTKKISYLEIKNLFNSHYLQPISEVKDDELFTSLNSLSNANKNELTFFNDTSQLKKLEKTKAKACLINHHHLSFLPTSTASIVVENTYKAFAILSNLFSFNNKSDGIISKYSSIDKSLILKKNVQIDSFVNIGNNCKIGENVIIHSNCKIGPNVVIG